MKIFSSYIVTDDKTCIGTSAQMSFQDRISVEEGHQGMVFHFQGVKFILILCPNEYICAYHYDERQNAYVLCDPLYQLSECYQKILKALLSCWYQKVSMIYDQIEKGEAEKIEIPTIGSEILH